MSPWNIERNQNCHVLFRGTFRVTLLQCRCLSAGSQSPDVPEDSSLAMSCAKSVAAVQKRKRGALSPDNTETPELRVKRADTGDQAAQQCTPTDVLPGKASYARLPSKRRLFE